MFNNNLSHTINYILSRTVEEGFVGIVGPAGIGKSTLAYTLNKNFEHSIYSIDYRFIGDSEDRKKLHYNKQKKSIDDYIDAINQFNWWNWNEIYQDIINLENKKIIKIENAYNRILGKKDTKIKIKHNKITIFEGAILGDVNITKKMKKIFFLWSDPFFRFSNLVNKDLDKRSFNEICARFLVTQFSENIYYKKLFLSEKEKLIFIDVNKSEIITEPALIEENFIPLKF